MILDEDHVLRGVGSEFPTRELLRGDRSKRSVPFWVFHLTCDFDTYPQVYECSPEFCFRVCLGSNC